MLDRNDVVRDAPRPRKFGDMLLFAAVFIVVAGLGVVAAPVLDPDLAAAVEAASLKPNPDIQPDSGAATGGEEARASGDSVPDPVGDESAAGAEAPADRATVAP
jgi:hypothetical protein